jgi:integrase
MTGIFAGLADDFLAFKRAQGYKYYSEAKVLRRFCRFAEKYPLEKPMLTKELITDWTSPREGEAKKSRMHRIVCINQFGKYLKQVDCEVYAVPPQSRWDSNSFTPYIFTHEEISKLFESSDNIRPIPQSRRIHKEMPVLIRLLYGCGLRVSEAVSLRCRDVNLEDGILTLREAKNGRDRLIPLSQSLTERFREYRNNVIPWALDDDFFFMAPDRTILSPNTVYGRFRRILWDGGIPYNGKGNGPRLHDLRHTFAVHTLQKWVENGEDLTAMLPILSVFMGHKSFGATSRYLRLTAEVYPDVVMQVEKTCAYAIPGGDSL